MEQENNNKYLINICLVSKKKPSLKYFEFLYMKYEKKNILLLKGIDKINCMLRIINL